METIAEIQKRVELWELFNATGMTSETLIKEIAPTAKEAILDYGFEAIETFPIKTFVEECLIIGMGQNPATIVFNF